MTDYDLQSGRTQHDLEAIPLRRWPVASLSDERLFSFESGIWTGERHPLANVPVIRNTNFTDDGRLDFSDVAVIAVEERYLLRKRLEAGDIIIERSGGGPLQPVGRVAMFDLEDGVWCFSNFTSRLRVLDREVIDPQFLHIFLYYVHVSGLTERLQRRTTGIRNLDFSAYKSIEIPLPPLIEQQAIVASLSSIQHAADTRRRELALERERKAALMHHLFTHGTRGETVEKRTTRFGYVPAHWRELRLDEAAYIQSGITMGRNYNGAKTVMKPYLRVANVQDGYLDLSEIKEIEVLVSEVDRYRLKSGDVVLTEGGDFDKLGRGFIWHDQIPECLHQNHEFAVRANPDIVSPEYLAYLTQSHYGKAYFLSVAHRTTNLASINSTKLKAFPLVVPSLSEQKEIKDVLRSCDEKLQALHLEDQRLTELFGALLENLMAGRLSTGSASLFGRS